MSGRDMSLNFLLAGVGGQGTLLASDLLALVGMEFGLDVKKSEVHGMAQRGGSVTSHVRWAQHVRSPLIAPGEVDYFLAFERLEALRHAEMVGPQGTFLINEYRIMPVSVSAGNTQYPTEAEELSAYARAGINNLIYVPAMTIAQDLGQVRTNNVVMLGALSSLLPVPAEIWHRVIASRMPARLVALNQRAFEAGRDYTLTRNEK
jgi:indolepyruvate ferredoxin oxidoreductase, beta subunit